MSFANPEVFFAFFLLPVVGWALYSSYKKGKDELLRVGGLWRGSPLTSIYLVKSFLTSFFLVAALLFLIIAWAGPFWGSTPVEEPQDGLDVSLVFDVSNSMTATDIRPSRLTQGVEAARFIVHSFPHARFSLIAFKGNASLLVPLTSDLKVIDQWLENLSPQVQSSSGTDIESGLTEGLRSLNSPSSRHRVIIMFTDGENRDGNPVGAARKCSAQGIEVFSFGLGTKQGSRLKEGSNWMTDDFGFTVITRLNDDILKSLAGETQGNYYIGAEQDNLRDLQSHLNLLANPATRGGVKMQATAQYRIFLILALISMGGFFLVRVVSWRNIF